MNHFASNHFASAHFASNHFAGEAGVIVEPPITTPGVGGGGGYARPSKRKPRYKLPPEKPINKYLEQAKEEDEIVIQLITALLTKGFFDEH